MGEHANKLMESAARLRSHLADLHFGEPVAFVYHPLVYAWDRHCEYLSRYGDGDKRVVFFGMNPGPFGMTQTGVPFGEVSAVRDWLRISGPVGKPESEHPKRRVTGFDCEKSEVSGRRLWGLFAARFGRPEAFFREHFVANYCPLVFMTATGANLTPDKLAAAEAAQMEAFCDAHLREVIEALRPEWVIGVGAFAEQRALRARDALGGGFRVGRILHPSPASPIANRDWAGEASRQLTALGVWSGTA